MYHAHSALPSAATRELRKLAKQCGSTNLNISTSGITLGGGTFSTIRGDASHVSMLAGIVTAYGFRFVGDVLFYDDERAAMWLSRGGRDEA